MPQVSDDQSPKTENSAKSDSNIENPNNGEQEADSDLIERLVAAGLEGNMDEINALDNRVLRGKIKAAIVKAKRAS